MFTPLYDKYRAAINTMLVRTELGTTTPVGLVWMTEDEYAQQKKFRVRIDDADLELARGTQHARGTAGPSESRCVAAFAALV